MAYCKKCGNEISRFAKECQNCGEPIRKNKTEKQSTSTAYANGNVYDSWQRPSYKKQKMRPGMNAAAIGFILLAAIMIYGEEPDFYIASAFGLWAIMFWCLAFSPKEKPNMFGKPNGIRKSLFVVLFCIVAFSALMMSPDEEEAGETGTQQTQVVTSQNENIST